MRTSQMLLALCTVTLLHQVRSDDPVEFKALTPEVFALLNEAVWVNCSTPDPKTYFETRLFKKDNANGTNWVATEVVVDDWEMSTMYCYLSPDQDDKKSPITVMAYALPSKVTIDIQPLLEEEKESTINCTVHDVAPQELLTINITRGGDVIDSKSYGGPHVLDKRTVSHVYTFTASRGDNDMNFSCEAILQLGREQKRTKSPEITVQTYALPKPVLDVPKWIELNTQFNAECTVANGFPPENINIKMVVEDTPYDVESLAKDGAIKATTQLWANYSDPGLKSIRCEAQLFNFYNENEAEVNVYELPIINFALSSNVVDRWENVTASCYVTNGNPEAYNVTIAVYGDDEKSLEKSASTHTFTACRGTPRLPVTCTAYIIGNTDLFSEITRTLEVYAPAEFDESLCPSNPLLVEGKSKFSCQAEGHPKATVECSKDGRQISNMEAVTKDMTGTYTCHATNQKGNDTKSVTVIVEYPPTTPIVTVSFNVTITIGDPFNITCQSDGLPSPAYRWLIPDNAEVQYSEDNTSIIISAAEQSHGGPYLCMVRNAHGQSLEIEEMTVVAPGVNIGLIVGLVVAGVVLVALVVLVRYCVWNKNRTGSYWLLGSTNRPGHTNGNIPTAPTASETKVSMTEILQHGDGDS